MKFHEVLSEIIDVHSVRSVDICEKLGLKKAYLSRIRSGSLVPPNFDVIDKIAGMLNVSADEYSRLAYAYQEEKTVKKYSESSKAFTTLYCISMPTPCDSIDRLQLSNGQFFCDEEAVKKALIKVAASAERTLKLYYRPEHDKIIDVFGGLVLNVKDGFEWLIPLEKTSESSELNMDSFINAIIVILSKKAEIKGQYIHIEEYPEYSVFPYYIANEKEILLFSRNCQNALYLNSAESVRLHCKSFDSIFNNSIPFMKLYDDISTFLVDFDSIMHFKNSNSKPDIYIIEKYPCIVFDLKYTELESHAAKSNDSIDLAKMYEGFMQKCSVDIGKIYNIFSDSGLNNFLTAEEYYEFKYGLSKSLSKELRFNALKNLLDNSSFSDNYNPMIIRLPIVNSTNVHTINIWSDGKMLIMFDLNGKYYIALLNENSIVKAFLDYLRMLIKCGLIRSKEETLEIMSKSLDEMKKQK